MFGENFELDQFRQQHAERIEAAERARLIRCLEASRRAESGRVRRAALHKRMMAATGEQLVRLGNRLQRAALKAN